jgi:hypothetical protein
MSDQYITTGQLGNVMRLIALGGQTGLLRVVRGQGGTREEGQVQFINGRITTAIVGQMMGGAAIAVLNSWSESAYVFEDGIFYEPQGPEIVVDWNAVTSSGSLPPIGSGSFPPGSYIPGQSGQIPPPGQRSQPNLSQPVPGGSGSMSGSFPPPVSGPSPYPPQANPGSNGSYPPGSSPYQPGAGQPPGYGTGPMPRPTTGWGAPDSGSLPGQSYPPQQLPPQIVARLARSAAILVRTARFDPNAMQALDRRERQVILLIDGRRTIDDVLRLTRRSQEEIRAILAHLIMLGLVE